MPSPEDFRLWETCMTINDTWAHNKNDHNYKSSQFLIQSLVEVTSRGGNFLLNVGPRPDGTVQPEFQERLQGIGKWLKVNGDSTYDTTYGPIQDVPGIRTTARGRSIYVHVLAWPQSSSLSVPGLNAKVEQIQLLADGKPLPFRQDESGLSITLPAQAPDPHVSVITVRVAG